jgi:hypothetical protein
MFLVNMYITYYSYHLYLNSNKILVKEIHHIMHFVNIFLHTFLLTLPKLEIHSEEISYSVRFFFLLFVTFECN